MEKRSLTVSEIEYIIDFIKPNKYIPEETAISIVNINKEKLRKQLRPQQLYKKYIKEDIEELKKVIQKQYFSSLIQTGESVGVITAQCMGEMTTQNTLNSVDWDTEIIISKNGCIITPKIGEFIDEYYKMSINSDSVKYLANDQIYIELNDTNDWKALSTDENGKMQWTKLESITRHPVINKDGSDTILEVKLKSGRIIKATKAKSFLIFQNGKIQPIDGEQLKIGDLIPIANTINIQNCKIIDTYNISNFLPKKKCKKSNIPSNILLDREFGFFCGAYVSGGISWQNSNIIISIINLNYRDKIACFADKLSIIHNTNRSKITLESIILSKIMGETFGYTYNNKQLPSFIYQAPDEFIKGFVDSYMSNNTCISLDDSITLSSVSKTLIEDFVMLFARYSINCSIHTQIHKDIIYHTLRLFSKSNIIFAKYFTIGYKQKFIIDNSDVSNFNETYLDSIVSIKEIKPLTKWVYDLTVEKTRNFTSKTLCLLRDTFHSAGLSVKTVITGVPRFEELLNTTHNPKGVSCNVYFTKGTENIQSLRNVIGNSIVELTFDKIALSINICMNKVDELWYEPFSILYNNEFKKHAHCISIKLNMSILFEYNLSISDIANKIQSMYGDLFCVYSNPNIGQLDIFVDVSNIDLDDEKSYLNHDNKYELYLDEVVKQEIKKCKLCGIEGITGLFYIKNDNEWMIQTEGSNYLEIMALPFVDCSKTTSNNIWDMVNVLGIEAAKQTLFEELQAIMGGINKCHLKLLVDKMTYTGAVCSISRYAMKKEQAGPMSKASFEQSLENFLNAAAFGEKENTRGVSASIMCGKKARIGTGICDLQIDVDMLCAE